MEHKNLESKTELEIEINNIFTEQPHLAIQSFETLKGDINPLTFEIMSRQATINIGNIFVNT